MLHLAQRLRGRADMKLFSVKKVGGSDPLMYMFWSQDEGKESYGNMGRMDFASEEDVRMMLITHGLSETEANAELSRVGTA
jgi:hypothetical protein